MIKIASWNINKFESSSVLKIKKFIVDESPDIMFIQEFPTNNIDKFMTGMNKTSEAQYELISQQSVYEGYYNITIALVKAHLKEHIRINALNDDIPFKLRLLELQLSINDVAIIFLVYIVLSIPRKAII